MVDECSKELELERYRLKEVLRNACPDSIPDVYKKLSQRVFDPEVVMQVLENELACRQNRYADAAKSVQEARAYIKVMKAALLEEVPASVDEGPASEG